MTGIDASANGRGFDGPGDNFSEHIRQMTRESVAFIESFAQKNREGVAKADLMHRLLDIEDRLAKVELHLRIPPPGWPKSLRY